MEERRKAKRIPLEANLAMNRIDGSKNELVPVQITDISKTGLGFECGRVLEIGAVYEIELVLWTKERFKSFINITRCANEGAKTIYGATFVGLTEGDSCKIDIYDLFNS